MSPAIQLIADGLQGDLQFILQTIEDFTDAELMQRPSPKSNHAMFQLGHVILGEVYIMNKLVPGAITPPDEAFAKAFADENASNDDLSKFPGKAKVVEELKRVRGQTIEAVKRIAEPDLAKPSPVNWAPTIGGMLMLCLTHPPMHVGQIQVLRRKLGKPILF